MIISALTQVKPKAPIITECVRGTHSCSQPHRLRTYLCHTPAHTRARMLTRTRAHIYMSIGLTKGYFESDLTVTEAYIIGLGHIAFFVKPMGLIKSTRNN